MKKAFLVAFGLVVCGLIFVALFQCAMQAGIIAWLSTLIGLSPFIGVGLLWAIIFLIDHFFGK